MPTLADNQKTWQTDYAWPQEGEEWSASWGGSEAQWYTVLLPRIQAFLPVQNVLEIAPGMGRWTHYLRAHCQRLIGVDLSQKCIDACKARFAKDPAMSFHANDGKSLAMVPDGSIDFVFSFDSLVHADKDVVGEYLKQIRSKLKPQGVGIIHHSNFGSFQEGFKLVEATPPELRKALFTPDFLGPTHWRDNTMSAVLFEKQCREAGLQCIGQELVNWGTPSLLIDCFSTFTVPGSRYARPNVVVSNPDFMQEAQFAQRRARMYSRASYAPAAAKKPG